MSKKEDQIDDKSEDVVEESQEEQQNDSDLNNLTYEELLEKVESLKEDSLRSAAELENFKRRTSNELSNALLSSLLVLLLKFSSSAADLSESSLSDSTFSNSSSYVKLFKSESFCCSSWLSSTTSSDLSSI